MCGSKVSNEHTNLIVGLVAVRDSGDLRGATYDITGPMVGVLSCVVTMTHRAQADLCVAVSLACPEARGFTHEPFIRLDVYSETAYDTDRNKKHVDLLAYMLFDCVQNSYGRCFC